MYFFGRFLKRSCDYSQLWSQDTWPAPNMTHNISLDVIEYALSHIFPKWSETIYSYSMFHKPDCVAWRFSQLFNDDQTMRIKGRICKYGGWGNKTDSFACLLIFLRSWCQIKIYYLPTHPYNYNVIPNRICLLPNTIRVNNNYLEYNFPFIELLFNSINR